MTSSTHARGRWNPYGRSKLSDHRQQCTLILGMSLVLTSGCFWSSSRQIEHVLSLDAQANAKATTVQDVVQRMRAIDTASCPNDFRSAYLAHVHAWEEMAAVERDYFALEQQSSSGAVFVESFVRGMFGDPFGKAGEIFAGHQALQQRYLQASQSVQSSWNRVEEIAVRYGAVVPNSVR